MKQKSELRPLILRAILLLCIVGFGVSLFFLPEIVARYRTSDGGNDEAQVAKFVFDTNFEEQVASLDLSDMKPGDRKNFVFELSNFENTNGESPRVCEVDLLYRISVQDMGNLPFIYTIVQVADINGTSMTNGHHGGSELQGEMEAGIQTACYYQVTVIWEQSSIGAEYADQVDNVTLRVVCDQID